MLRFSADNYHYTDVEATGDALRVSLQPIAVTGKVTSSFTSEGVGATVRGTEATKTRSDGTFTTYGVGPGDTVTVTAFGHAPKKVKVPASREMQVSLSLGRIDPARVFREIPGYGSTNAPAEMVAAMRAEAGFIPLRDDLVTGFAAKSITKNGEGIGMVIVAAVEPSWAALPTTQHAVFDGISYGAPKFRDVKIGDIKTRFAQDGDFTAYAWQRFASFVFVMSFDGPTHAKRIAEGMIGAPSAVPFKIVEPFNGTVAATKDFARLGGARTVRVAVAAVPLPPSVEVGAEVVLTFAPAMDAVTLTENVHDAPAASVAPLKLIEVAVAAAAIAPTLPHVPVRPSASPTARPAGSVSVKPTPVSGSPPSLVESCPHYRLFLSR